ncbi:MAG TPA: 6-bladed beta-propeller [Longimicrobiales bacterium]|nr:6-bladed beta-propeller [Longimicrobiales bacterium]
MKNVAAALVLVLVATGCGPEVIDVPAPDDGVAVTVIDPVALESAPALEVREAVVIDGEGAGFSHLPGLVTRGDTIIALDQMACEVFVFDGAGRLVRRFGGEGDGPGELRRPDRMAISGDTLFIIDQRGLSQFLVDGTFLSRVAIDTRAAGGTPNFLPHPQSLAPADGRLITSFSGRRSRPPDGTFADTVPIHPLTRAGEVLPAIAGVITDHIHRVDTGMDAPALFAGRSSFVVAPGGSIYVSRQDGVHIDVLSRDGEPMGRLRLDVPRREVTSRDVDSALNRIEQSFGAAGVEALTAKRKRALRRLPYVRYRPAVGRMVAGEEDLLLVQRLDLSPVYPMDTDEVVWDLVRADASIEGRITLPGRFRPWVVEQRRLTGIYSDSADVPTIVQYAW